jgi:hypothetical protein
MFFNCRNIKEIVVENTSAVTTLANFADGCWSVERVEFSAATTGVTTMASAFSSCFTLRTIENLDGTATTSSAAFTNTFLNNYSLQYLNGTNLKFSHSIANTEFDGNELDTYYGLLPTVSGQTLTITNSAGAAFDDPSIATSKGWTVTG